LEGAEKSEQNKGENDIIKTWKIHERGIDFFLLQRGEGTRNQRGRE